MLFFLFFVFLFFLGKGINVVDQIKKERESVVKHKLRQRGV